MQPYIMGGYRRHWGTEPYANQWGVNAYRPPFASRLQGAVRLGDPDDPGDPGDPENGENAERGTPFGNAVLHIVAGGLIGAAITAAATQKAQRVERAVYGAGMTAGAVAIVDAFIVGRESASTGISLGLLGLMAISTSFYAASKGY
jgi:hypothetical protein